MFDPSRLTDEVVVECFDDMAQDAHGNETGGEWGELIEAQPAALIAKSGGETVQQGRMEGRLLFEVVLRFNVSNQTITEKDRLRVSRPGGALPVGSVLNIKHVPIDVDQPRRRWLRFQAEFGSQDGN